MELKKFASEVVEKASSLVDDIELCIGTGKGVEFEIQNRKISPKVSMGRAGIGIRILKDGKMASAAITRLDVGEALLAVKKALTNMKLTSLTQFAEIKDVPVVKNYDPKVLELFDNPPFLREIAEQMRDRLYAEAKDIENFGGGIGVTHSERLIATKGGLAFSEETAVEAFAQINSVDFDFYVGCNKPDDFENIKNLGLNLYKAMPKEFITPAEMGVVGKELDVIFDPQCLSSIFRVLFGEKVYGSAKDQGFTDFSVGDLIADKKLTVIDTGIKEGLLSSSPTDDEGTASRKNIVIENGVLKTFLYDVASALKAGKKSTGNGMRRPILAEDGIEAPVREKLRGLHILPGSKLLAGILKDIKKGIYVKSLLGLHTADKVRASFVSGVYSGKSIEDGKYKHLLTPGQWNISANLFDLDGKKGMLMDVELSKETFNTGSAILPWMKVRLRF